MSDYLDAARETERSLRRLSVEDLIPTEVNPDPSSSEILCVKLVWFIRAICSRGSLQQQAYGQERPIRLRYDVFAAAIARRNGVVREQLRNLEQPDRRLSLIRIHDHEQNSLEILPPTRSDVIALMQWRKKRETEAALLVHRQERFDGVPAEPHAKLYLCEKLRGILNQSKAAQSEIASGRLSARESHVRAELIWHLDCLLHRLLLQAAGMTMDEPTLAHLRHKMRLVDSYQEVICGRVEPSQQEHAEIIESTCAGCSSGSESEDRIVRAFDSHIDASTAALLKLVSD